MAKKNYVLFCFAIVLSDLRQNNGFWSHLWYFQTFYLYINMFAMNVTYHSIICSPIGLLTPYNLISIQILFCYRWMAKQKRTKRQAMVDKILHRKLNIELFMNPTRLCCMGNTTRLCCMGNTTIFCCMGNTTRCKSVNSFQP
jgi:hypothetical protein